jgi:aminoglycoside phosphotransferase (APT) family kinase protein
VGGGSCAARRSARGWRQPYAAATGRDLTALPFWHALGLWKIAIICEGVGRRALDDHAPPPGLASRPEVKAMPNSQAPVTTAQAPIQIVNV